MNVRTVGQVAAVIAIVTSFLHLVILVLDEHPSLVTTVVLCTFAASCAGCARGLWTRADRRVWVTVAAMYSVMMLVHAALALAQSVPWTPLRHLGEAGHPHVETTSASGSVAEYASMGMHALPILQIGICVGAMSWLWHRDRNGRAANVSAAEHAPS